MNQETLIKIHQTIKWLEDNSKTQDIDTMSIKLNELALYTVYFSEQVSDAHQQMDLAEEDYKSATAKYVAESTLPAAKSEREAEVLFGPMRKEFILMKSIQRKCKGLLDRVDRVLDHHKQRVSVVKQAEMKHI